jgi:3-mercaptopyruvate sulfurtransferase SseA
MTVMKNEARRLSFLILSVFLILIPLYLYSCSGGGYENPQVQSMSTSVLISPQTLNGWITTGYGTDSRGFNKIVVLDATAATGTTSYTTTGHVPGAFLVEPAADLNALRSDGVSGVINEVATRSQIDDVIHRTGIDKNTVVVITGDSLLNVGTAYFTFRYWGFPKERLKVMSGTNKTYSAAGFPLENTVPPAPAPSTYSVCQLTQNTSMRASLSDMISFAEGSTANAFAWDVRTPDEYNGVAGKTLGPSSSAAVGYTAFEGHVKGAINLNYTTLLSSDASTFLDTDTIRTALNTIGVTADKRTHVY